MAANDLEKTIRLSVIVPVYNVEKYLSICIDSILCQHFDSFEVILIDDGSPDDCGSICDAYQKKDHRVHVLHQKNGGLSSARNAGIREARGEYLFFVDSDDFLVSDAVLSGLNDVLAQTNPDFLQLRTLEYDESGTKVIYEQEKSPWTENTLYDGETIIDSIYQEEQGWVTIAQTKIISREFCLNHQLFFKEKIYHEDDEWVSRVLTSNPRIAFTNIAGYGYRHRSDSIVSTEDAKKQEKRIESRVYVGYTMLLSEKSMIHKEYCLYAARYFWSAFLSLRILSPKKQDELFQRYGQFSEAFRRFRYTRRLKWIVCSFLYRILGKHMFLSLLKCLGNA